MADTIIAERPKAKQASRDIPIIFSAQEVASPKRYDISVHNADRIIPLPDDELRSRYEAGETIADLAAAYSVSRPTARKALRRAGTAMRKAVRRPGVGCGAANSSWKGGRRVRADGYVLIWTPEGEQLEHRVVMQRHLGRKLQADEIVHHRDGDKSNNDISNLEVMTQREHAKHHSPEMHAARYGHG